jgi:head-tail adaptor
VPNPGGRVFTASGQELVQSEIGFTLAYAKDQTLNLETRIKKGGQLLEVISLSADGDTLTINIEIDRRDWKWIAKVDRVFHRVH